MPEIKKKFKSGFVVLVGRSNVGKSTLLNSLVGTKVAITSPRPLTTRHVIRGVLHDVRGQAVFIDTPGIFQKAYDRLTSTLTRRAKEALRDVEVALYVVDPTRAPGKEENTIFNLLQKMKIPKILAVNKIDLRKKPYLEDYRQWREDFDEYIEISALKRKNIRSLIDLIFKHLPLGVPFYPEFQFTDMEQKFWLAELIREKVYLVTRQEIPYTTDVRVEEALERENGVFYIKADIITTKPKYQQILIGARGAKIKEIGQMARKELEQVFNRKVYLELEVRVEPHWPERFV